MAKSKCKICGKEFYAVTEQDCEVQLAIHLNKDKCVAPKEKPKKEVKEEPKEEVVEKPAPKSKGKPKKK